MMDIDLPILKLDAQPRQRRWLKNRNFPKRPNSPEVEDEMPEEDACENDKKRRTRMRKKSKKKENKNAHCWQTSNGKNRNCHPRIVESVIMGAGNRWFLSLELGQHTCCSRKPSREIACGDRIDTDSTGDDAAVAASAWAVRLVE
jgi:hypothetical protein